MVKTVSDVRCGSFPVACGRFAPEGFDADVEVDDGRKPRCQRCNGIVDAEVERARLAR